MCYDDLYVYDVKLTKWFRPRVRGEIPPGRGKHVAVAWGNDTVVIMGGEFVFGGLSDHVCQSGSSGGHFRSDTFILNVTSFEWRQLTTFGARFSAREGHSAVMNGDQMIVFGGFSRKVVAHPSIW